MDLIPADLVIEGRRRFGSRRDGLTIGASFPSVLDAARTGAEWAWTQLYRDLAPVVSGYLRAHGAREAEDLTSEVFLAMVRGLDSFEGDESGFRSWVFVIAHRRLLDERRSHARHPVDPHPAEDLDAVVEDFSGQTLRNLEAEQVRALFSHLSEDQRDVLLLRMVAGLSVDETAEAVGKRPGAVKALQRRGLAALSRMISKEAVSR